MKILAFVIIVKILMLGACCKKEHIEYPISDETKKLIPYSENDTLKLKDSDGKSIELYTTVISTQKDVDYGGEQSCKTGVNHYYEVILSNPLDESLKISWDINSFNHRIDIVLNNKTGASYYYYPDNSINIDNYKVNLLDTLTLNGSIYTNVYKIINPYPSDDKDDLKSIFYNYEDKLIKIDFKSGESYFIDK